MILIVSCELITDDKLKYEDTKFFEEEASLTVLTKVARDIYDTVCGRKNGSGGCIDGSCLFVRTRVVATRFCQRGYLLQYLTEEQRSLPDGCQLMLIHSTKCHPELAEEGTEYDWGAAQTMVSQSKTCGEANKRPKIGKPKSQPSENKPEDGVFSSSKTASACKQTIE
jgi:hypothetical protein